MWDLTLQALKGNLDFLYWNGKETECNAMGGKDRIFNYFGVM
jgi:hypothetical protein